jgi:hypothetical protein
MHFISNFITTPNQLKTVKKASSFKCHFWYLQTYVYLIQNLYVGRYIYSFKAVVNPRVRVRIPNGVSKEQSILNTKSASSKSFGSNFTFCEFEKAHLMKNAPIEDWKMSKTLATRGCQNGNLTCEPLRR